jgi:hypothetical protein
MGRFDLQPWTRIGAMNRSVGVEQRFQPVPAFRQDACSTARLMDRLWRVARDAERTADPPGSPIRRAIPNEPSIHS